MLHKAISEIQINQNGTITNKGVQIVAYTVIVDGTVIVRRSKKQWISVSETLMVRAQT